MGLMLDTDHCVAILRKRLAAASYVQPTETLYVSVVTVLELIVGASSSAQVDRNMTEVERLLATVSILPFDEASARQTARIKAAGRKTGMLLSDLDMEIAGTALAHRLPLVTHNKQHFERVGGLSLLDWLS